MPSMLVLPRTMCAFVCFCACGLCSNCTTGFSVASLFALQNPNPAIHAVLDEQHHLQQQQQQQQQSASGMQVDENTEEQMFQGE